MLPPLVLDAQGFVFHLGIGCSGMCSILLLQALEFLLGLTCSGMCAPLCYKMLKDVCFLIVLYAQVCVPHFITSSGCVFPLVVTCSGICVSSCYYMLRDMLCIPSWY